MLLIKRANRYFPIIEPILKANGIPDDFKYLVAALAGFMGYGRFGMLIEGFDLFEGRFHHNSLDEPFPDEP